jgi:hypothetical protein
MLLCRAKNIQNEAHVNEDVDQRTLLRKYERELRRLRDELARRSRNVVDKRALLVVGTCIGYRFCLTMRWGFLVTRECLQQVHIMLHRREMWSLSTKVA